MQKEKKCYARLPELDFAFIKQSETTSEQLTNSLPDLCL